MIDFQNMGATTPVTERLLQSGGGGEGWIEKVVETGSSWVLLTRYVVRVERDV